MALLPTLQGWADTALGLNRHLHREHNYRQRNNGSWKSVGRHVMTETAYPVGVNEDKSEDKAEEDEEEESSTMDLEVMVFKLCIL
ncbi:hypothetical protein V6N13_000132 [Hibiscus sabdariffa]|uniref:Uncharacterized protein n=1 Tax=Hibiscus sabdariffa TaxID=183260 RepID=A0ABR2ARY7_9ROSI